MKILLVGDQHHRLELPYAAAFEDGRRGEWENVVATIHSASHRADLVILMGDNLNARHNHSSVLADFVNFLQGFGKKEVRILTGNHERYGLSTALDFLDLTMKENWCVHTTPCGPVNFNGTTISFIPYMTPAMVEGAEGNEDAVEKFMETLVPADIAVMHQGITGAKVHGTMVDLFNEMVFPQTTLEKKFKKIFSGHIHQAQTVGKKIQMTGSIFSMEVGEHSKSIFMYDTETGTVEDIPLPVRGIYLVEDKKDMSKIPDDSIVKYIVTDKAIDVEEKKKEMERFDASFVIEKYPMERRKMHVADGAMDLDINSLLEMYAKSKNVLYSSLREGLDLLLAHDNSRT
jgi:DNA repair exonuclease SbcCD nuclease subunit